MIMRRRINTQRIDRRRFLAGAGGAVLALPMLEAHAPRVAYGASAAPPKRLVIFAHPQGRTVGNGRVESSSMQDNWSPLSQTGELPSAETELSPLLASLGDLRDIVTIDGVDNLVRHMTGNQDGHVPSELTCLTCALPTSDMTSGGPSIDWVAGQRLRASASQPSSLVFPASVLRGTYDYEHAIFYGEGGTAPALVESAPELAIRELFGDPTPASNEPPPRKTLRDRLTARRGSILDAVAKDYLALSSRVSATDRERLEQHANFIRTVETRVASSGGGALAQGCERPDESRIPSYNRDDNKRGDLDEIVTPWIVENLVMSLACDVTRVANLHYCLHFDPTFASEFDGKSPLGGSQDWHSMIHDTPQVNAPNAPPLTQAFQYLTKLFGHLVQRLSEVSDTDGSSLLDNTLVLWVSDLGYGAAHHNFNIPVVLAGMPSAFQNGLGRHVVFENRRSLGDLYAEVLRMLGGTDTTFGATGTVGDTGLSDPDSLNAWSGYDNFIKPSLPLHLGPLDL